MRAQEFIIEDQVGKITKRNQNSTVGLNKFRDPKFADRVYELNRVMMAVASNDGTNFVQEIDGESWAGRYDIAAPYTKIEQKMLKKAYQAVGSKYHDLNHGDLESQEHPAVHTTSPVQAFKGYPR
jgi:hypothetical protein